MEIMIAPVAFDADQQAITTLRSALQGELVLPDHPEYNSVRQVWNGRVDHRPVAIVRVRHANDVALALAFAHQYALTVSVRGGGHNGAGLAVADRGLMIDLSLMKGLTIDSEQRVARAEAGLTLGEIVPALAAHHLATTTGTCAGTGLAGSTLGGGIGWLASKHGMAIDNLLAVELVTADGRFWRVSAQEQPDLFWALRGGGGNFGVVTALEYRLHPLGQVLGGMLVYPLAVAGEVLKAYRSFLATAPDAAGSLAVLTTFPELGPVVMLQLCYADSDLRAGEELFAPLRSVATPLLDTLQPMAYGDFFMAYSPPAPNGMCYYDTACSLPSLSDEAIAVLIANLESATTPQASIIIHSLRGAATRVAPQAAAYALRSPHIMIVNAAKWEAGAGENHIAWANNAFARLCPHSSGGLYINFMGIGSDEEVQAAYGANYQRLAALKAEYDPQNTFRLNQNIPPVRKYRGL
jgi:FAD/FMN-containing dehydrogenase